MERVFRAFIESLYGSPDTLTLRSAMNDIAIAFDLGTFAYLFVPKRGDRSPRLISTYPTGWIDHYLASGYDRVDPVIDQARHVAEPFQWGRETWCNGLAEEQIQVLEEALRFGIRAGFTIPIHDPLTGVAAVTFVADQHPRRFSRCISRHRSVLHLLAILFHSRARLKFLPNRCVGGVLLSPREHECLEWSARGKSAWEIGRILEISRRTAAFHLDNARMKLDVRTLAQAIAKLVSSIETAR
jgi:LuxR family transcriptional activator of conjugal transfer of Ti plasmids